MILLKKILGDGLDYKKVEKILLAEFTIVPIVVIVWI